MRCGECGAANAARARFCDQCGIRLGNGATDRPATDRVGANQVEAAVEAGRDGPSDVEAGDRRIVTALFADLVGYSRLVAELDAEEVRPRVDAALSAIDEAIAEFGGTREKFIGDAVFAVFGHPSSHDDDALRAMHCALAIRASLARSGGSAGTEPLEVRIGIATGEVVAAPRAAGGDGDWSLTGSAVTTAARIQALADPGEILLDEAALRAARKAFAVQDRGTRLLRGQRSPVRLFTLIGVPGFQPWSQPGGRLVGRDRERAAIRQQLEATRETGRGGALVVIGDAGIGKSRLLADVEDDARAAGFAWTWTENVSYGTGEPYRYARVLAQAIADEQGTDSGAVVRRLLLEPGLPPDEASRLAGAVAAIAREAAFSGWEAEVEHMPADPAAMASAVLDVASRYTDRLIDELGPRVIVIDDLHWLDHSSAGMVDRIVEEATRRPLVVLAGARPGPLPRWTEMAGVTRIDVEGLAPAETEELATAVAGGAVDPTDARRLHERTGGNPLFIAESVRALMDAGDLPVRNGRLALGTPAADAAPPVTLRAVLGARIDALADEARLALRVASVIGIDFREPLVAALVDRPVDPAVFGSLEEAALILRLDGLDGWRFSHPLVHDTAYAGLLASRRRVLHARIADFLESGGSLETRVGRRPRRLGNASGASGAASIGVIALHRARAGDAERAVPLLVAAAEAAMAAGAASEAAAFWRQAADLTGSSLDAASYRQRAIDADPVERTMTP